MAKQYRANAFVRINNAVISSLLRLGIKVWSFSLLTVRGRKSGKPIETPLADHRLDRRSEVGPGNLVRGRCGCRNESGDEKGQRSQNSSLTASCPYRGKFDCRTTVRSIAPNSELVGLFSYWRSSYTT